MLSSEASALTRLLLARHALICRASELRCAPQAAREVVLMPLRIGELDARISRAWRRLEEVRPL